MPSWQLQERYVSGPPCTCGKPLSPYSKRIAFVLSLLLFLPAIATVAAPPGLRINTPTISPASPGPNDQVTVNVTVTAGSGVKNVTIHYTTDAWKTNATVAASYNSTSQLAIAHIPPLYNGGNVTYYIVAFDNNNNKATNDNNGNYFTYTVSAPTGFTATTGMWIEIGVVIAAVGAAVSVGFYALRPRKSTS